jgi:hypothetical protein
MWEVPFAFPSSGRPKGRFAPFGPPLMSNVGRHKSMIASAPIANPKTQRLAALGVLVIGVVALLVLPMVGVVLARFHFASPASILLAVTASLFPFLFTEQVSTVGGITQRLPVVNHPFIYTFLQWCLLVGGNVGLVRFGLSRRPFLSALAVTVLAATVAAGVVVLQGLHFAVLRT